MFTSLDAGTYTLSARWGNDDCPVDLPDVTLSDENGPSVDAGDDVTICEGGSATLTASATGGTGTITYSWSNGDAGATITVNPTVTTTYTVTAEDANGCESTDQVIVNVVPDAEVTIEANDPTTVCEGGSVSFTSEVTGGLDCGNVTWQVRPVGGTYVNAGTGSSFSTATDLTPGNYQIRARVVCSGEGCGNDVSAPVTIIIASDPEVTVSLADDELCEGEGTTVTAEIAGGLDCDDVLLRYRTGPGAPWINLGTGLSASIPTDLDPGTYQVQARYVCNGTACDNATDIVNLTVYENPTATVAPTEICSGESGTLIVTAAGGDGNYTYAWESNASTSASATYGPLTSTTSYEVTVTDGNGCSVVTSGTITVKPQPVAVIDATPTTVCDDESVTFTAMITVGGTDYTWNFGAGASPATATGPGPHVVTYNNDDSANDLRPTVTLDVERDGCTASATEEVRVRPQPEVSITAENDPTTCLGQDGSITVSVTKPANTSVEISLDGGGSFESCNQTTFTGLGAGTYDIVARYCNDDCPVSVGTVSLSDPLSPVAEIAGPSEVCDDDSGENISATFTAIDAGAGATYAWNFGDGTASTDVSGTHTYAVDGDFTVTLVVNDGAL
ncbi:MAG: PKD domain-containing protein, partial [Bacteroidota bacterium]